VEDGEDDASTNDALSQGAVNLLHQLEDPIAWGLGWGHLIGQLVTWLEENPQQDSTISDVCPLVGNARLPARNYQSDENVRLVAQQLWAHVPHFLFLPALAGESG
jgi:deoxyribonucleoside regulator